MLLYMMVHFTCGAQFNDYADLANIYWRTSPFNKNDTGLGRVDFNTYAVDFKAPIQVGDLKRVIVGADISNNGIIERGTQNNWSFSSTALQLGYQYGHEDNKLVVMLMPKFSTTFTGGLDKRDFQLGGAILRTKLWSQNFRFRYGAYVNQELFSLMIVPMIGFDWQISEKWRLKSWIPVNLDLSYTIKNDRLITGLLFIGANASYRMRGQINPFTTYPTNYQPYLDKADNNAWLYADMFITKNVVLNVRAGYSVLRRYRFYDEDDKLTLKIGPANIGNDRANSPMLMRDGMSFEMRLIFRVKVPPQYIGANR